MTARKPKFDFMPTLRTYGKLDTSKELLVCTVIEGRVVVDHCALADSWETCVMNVGSPKSLQAEIEKVTAYNADLPRVQLEDDAIIEAWNAENPDKKPKKSVTRHEQRLPVKRLVMGLNEPRDAYEVVYDPHDIAGEIDPMMLLNFRRKFVHRAAPVAVLAAARGCSGFD
jgi:hypothetical protein